MKTSDPGNNNLGVLFPLFCSTVSKTVLTREKANKLMHKIKMKKLFLAGFLAIGLLAAGCSKEQAPEYSGETGTGKIKISVQSGNTTPAGRAIGAPSQTLENTVKSFTVYVFNNATGVLEKSQTFNNTLNGEMSGLSVASAKKVVVFVNQPASYSAIANY